MNGYLPSVNQKRLFASLLLEQADAAGDQRHLEQALLQGAVFHLATAVTFFFGEVAEAYQCPAPAAATTADTLAAMLADKGKAPAEAGELVTLARDSGSWLSQLFDCRGALEALPAAFSSSGAEPELIAAVAVTSEDWSRLEGSRVAAWLHSFGEMVERHRESMVEC